jgi:hypothetical protein
MFNGFLIKWAKLYALLEREISLTIIFWLILLLILITKKIFGWGKWPGDEFQSSTGMARPRARGV